MQTVTTIITIILCMVMVLGILIGLQHIISYQAQIVFDEYNAIHSTQKKLNLNTSFKTSSETSP